MKTITITEAEAKVICEAIVKTQLAISNKTISDSRWHERESLNSLEAAKEILLSRLHPRKESKQ